MFFNWEKIQFAPTKENLNPNLWPCTLTYVRIIDIFRRNTVNTRFPIFRCSDSQIPILKFRYPSQIPAIATLHPTKFPIFVIISYRFSNLEWWAIRCRYLIFGYEARFLERIGEGQRRLTVIQTRVQLIWNENAFYVHFLDISCGFVNNYRLFVSSLQPKSAVN